MSIPIGRISLRVTERLGVERTGYPVTLGVPFPAGALRSIEQLRLLDPTGRDVPCQAERLDLADWPDGSIKGIRVDFQATAGSEQTATYSLEYGSEIRAQKCSPDVKVVQDADAVRVDTGPVRFAISRRSFRLFESVQLDGIEMMDAARPRGFFVTSPNGVVYDAGVGRPTVEVESAGPLRASIKVTGAHVAPDGDRFLDFVARIEAFAGLPFVKVTYGFYNMGQHCEDRLVNPGRGALFRVPYSTARDITLKVPLALGGNTETLLAGCQFYVHRVRGAASLYYGWCRRPHDREGTGHILQYSGEDHFLYPGTIEDSSSGCEMVNQGAGRTMQIRYGPHVMNSSSLDVPEILEDRPNGKRGIFSLGPPDGWVDLSNVERGMALCVREFDMLPPKSIETTTDSIDLSLWPARAGDLDLGLGSGKSHELFFIFHKETGAKQKIDWLCETFREPLVAAVDPAWIQQTTLLGDIYPPQTWHRPDFEKRCRMAFLSEPRCRPSMMDYPEYVVSTVHDKSVTHNNDGDRVMSLMLQFARTSDPSYFVAARAQARHTMDVDFVRYSPDPLMNEGLHMHSYDHVTGVCLPSHSWIEGFLYYYYLTGAPEAIDVARAVGRNLSRQVFAPRLLCYCDEREAGWPLIMLSSLYQATGDAEVARAARHLLDMLDAWQDKISGVWHVRWRQGSRYTIGGGGFMRAVIFCGLYKWWRATGDEHAKEIFRRGIFTFADEVANLTDFTAREFLNLECLAYAWRMLGDRTCMDKGMKAWQFLSRMGQGGYPIADVGAFRSAFHFMHVADELGLVSRAFEQE